MSLIDLTTVGVVIPFYQKDPEILKRCIASISTQNLPSHVRFLIVIVDDESPLPLNEALKGVDIDIAHELVCLKRKNGGPGAARNTALDYLATRNPEFIAFIDSDDIWNQDHISRALDILGNDGDFYFCDHSRWDSQTSYFEDSVPLLRWIASHDSPLIELSSSEEGQNFEFRHNESVYCFLEDYLAQTSTVVYRFALVGDIRFEPSLRYAGEDHMFWLDLAKASCIVRLSTHKDITTGKGVNIYASAVAWSHPNSARRVRDQVLAWLKIVKKFSSDERANLLSSRVLRWYSIEFAEVWCRKLLKAPIEALRIIQPLILLKPSLPFEIVLHMLRRDYVKRGPNAYAGGE